MFSKPFDGEHRVMNVFDHDLPVGAEDVNRSAVDWRGRRFRANGAQDGHAGYDFKMREGTPVLAAAAGKVLQAGWEEARPCHLRKGLKSALVVKILHRAAATGEYLVTNYVHLSRLDVKVGDEVEAGRRLGLSGNTGCSSTPHLHFAAARQLHTTSGTRNGVYFDPSGWSGAGADPWALDPRGAESTRMWIEGQGPAGL